LLGLLLGLLELVLVLNNAGKWQASDFSTSETPNMLRLLWIWASRGLFPLHACGGPSRQLPKSTIANPHHLQMCLGNLFSSVTTKEVFILIMTAMDADDTMNESPAGR
jgi:hypothetical protein